MFKAGDVVSIMEDRAEVCKLQKGHGEWNEEMTPVRQKPRFHKKYLLQC